MEHRKPEIVVSVATEQDVDAFASFLREAWRQAGPDSPGFAGATEDVIEALTEPQAVLERIVGSDRRLFLARRSGEVVGFAANRRIDDRSVELAGIVVLQRLLGRGIGTPLVEAAAQFAAEDGFERMVVRTEAGNDRALGFYEAKGFRRIGTAIEHVEDAAVEVWELARTLTSRPGT